MRIIAGEARGRKIEAPSGRNTRPTLDRVRENLFNMLQGNVVGSVVLDLFAGSGALSLEAVSRGAAHAVMIDSDWQAAAVQKKNITCLRYEDRISQFHCDWEKGVSTLRKDHLQFDLVFLDPPYSFGDREKVFQAIRPLLQDDSMIVLEHASGETVPVPSGYFLLRERSWGYCAVSIYKPADKGA